MTGHGFEQSVKCHRTALRMGDGLRVFGLWDGVEESYRPVAQCDEGCEGEVRVEMRVWLGPVVLLEGIDDVVGLGDGLAEAEAEGDVDVGEVTEDLGRGPFAWRVVALQTGFAEGFCEAADAGRGFADGRERVAAGEEFLVGVRAHCRILHFR